MTSISLTNLALAFAVAPGPVAGPADATEVPKAAEAVNEPPSSSVVLPDLGTIRYHDPTRPKQTWLGVDTGGIVVPAATSGLGRRVWSAYAAPTWALVLLPRVTIGGRHKLSWYDAGNVRLRIHSHELELSGRTMKQQRRIRDRPAIGMEVHDVQLSVVDGVDFRLGGIRDVVLHLGYGLEHDLTPWLQLGWRTQLRQVWVFRDTQRQARVSARLALRAWDRHRFALEAVGFYVNRSANQAGEPVPRNSLHGQVLGEYTWIGARGVGLVISARYCTSFLSGEAPIYEIRSESLRTHYGEVLAGLRFAWE